jgi:hypothetical protein
LRLRRREVGLLGPERQRFKTARGIVGKRDMAIGNEREAEAAYERGKRKPSPQPNGERPHLMTLYGARERAVKPAARTIRPVVPNGRPLAAPAQYL